ncbi:hypothetical protein G6011_01123 [Alternaria panax]|uniref:Uncharacterized protein n=1 Tax=Alternaria panax TaxID=48097 RepID=A0AAD4IJF3_9PLEO|nr:hypothetical protein G6011_01123 [Alternaria panax]
MATSSDQATHLDVTAPLNAETAAENIESPKEELLSQEGASRTNPLPVVSENFAREPKKSGEVQELDHVRDSAGVEKVTLGSPFPSPKPIADDCGSMVSLEESEIVEEIPSKPAVAIPALVQGHEEQSNGKADLELEASPIVMKESSVASTPEVQAETAAVSTDAGDSESKTDADMTCGAIKTSKPVHSLPPHMRPDFQSPPSHHVGLQYSRHMMPPNEVARFNEGLRPSRFQNTLYQPRSDHMDREQFARISAQLMKTKHELDSERNKNRRLRTTIEAEQQQKIEAASSSMLTNLLRDQAESLTLKAKVEARERELDLREQKISQHEVYLSEGQKQLWFSLEKNGVRPMSAVDMQHAQRDAELNAQKAIADVSGKLNIKMEVLRLREAAQQMREQQYKAMIRDSLKEELESPLTDNKAEEIDEIEYNNGLGAGKEVGCKEAFEKSHKIGFLEGYGACHRAQSSLFNMRAGRIPYDSPELNFLFDPSHPHNLHNIGMQIGELEAETEETKKEHGNKSEGEKSHGNGNIVGHQEQKRIADTRSHEEVPHLNGRVYGNTNGTMVHKREELVSRQVTPPSTISSILIPTRIPPARLTFAAELRGPSATHNGHIILANSAASPVGKETERPITKYEESVANLIDFM